MEQRYAGQPFKAPVARRSGNMAAFITLLIGIAVLAFVWLQRQNIFDWWALRDYTPPTSIASLAVDTTMTDHARKVFYVNKPQILDRTPFNEKCSDHGEQTIVLGCYHGGQRGIYLFDITDQRLVGVQQVTAAHELLHAEYDRLSSKEREHIDGLLEAYYQNSLTDQRIKDVIDSYKITEPHDVVNEMHSIFGTEVSDLPTELEDYYARYFSDRKKIIAYANDYQSEFIGRKNQVTTYDKQLAELKSQITTKQTSLEEQNSNLVAQRSQLEFLIQSDAKAYNEGAAKFNREVKVYNQSVEELKALVVEHNALVDKRNTIALEQQELSQAIDSHVESL